MCQQLAALGQSELSFRSVSVDLTKVISILSIKVKYQFDLQGQRFSHHETRWGFYHFGQGGLELLTSSDSPTLASKSAGVTGQYTRNEVKLADGVKHPNTKKWKELIFSTQDPKESYSAAASLDFCFSRAGPERPLEIYGMTSKEPHKESQISVIQARVQWHALGSLQPLPPGFNRDGFLPHWSGWLKLLTSGDLLPLASQSVGIKGLSHSTWPGKPGDPQAEQPHGSPVRLFRPVRLLCRHPGAAVLRTKYTGLCALLTGEWS
ncbi:hypothetical protein AAY473_040473 [Plecturocebus cupreus]